MFYKKYGHQISTFRPCSMIFISTPLTLKAQILVVHD